MIQSAINSVVGNVSNTAFRISLLANQRAAESLQARAKEIERIEKRTKEIREFYAQPTEEMMKDMPSVSHIDLSKINKKQAKLVNRGGEQ